MRRFVFIFLIATGAFNVDSWQCAFAQEEEVEVIETEINISKQGATFRPSVGGIGGELKKLYSEILYFLSYLLIQQERHHIKFAYLLH